MNETVPDYCDLRAEDTWIDYLRSRLPYSFNRIEEKGRGQSRHFVLLKPVLLSGEFAGERHNFWRRGSVFYMSGKLLDYYSMSDLWQGYRMLEVLRLLTNAAGALAIWPTNTYAYYNSMQMERVWGFAQENHLDRERVLMTSVTQAVELCLKATTTHASFRETGCFKFNAGHDVAKLYEDLPDSLRDEFAKESKVFARDYLAFRKQVRADFQKIKARHFSQPRSYPGVKPQAEADWDQMAKRISESYYTAFLNSNDPGETNKQLHQGWLEEALSQIAMIEEPRDISQYFRYAPHKDKDELPTDLIHWVLMLGRFMYEHLFPVTPLDNGPISSGFPIL